jgi:uroporphyrinogen-III synthase
MSAKNNEVQVLCTRPLPDWLLEEAAANGIGITVKPFIETIAIDTLEVQQEIELALLQQAVVVFTSMNAVEAVAAQLYGQVPQWEIYCMGTATRRLVAENFGEAAIAGTAADASELAALIIEEADCEEVIFFCGNQRLTELPTLLQNNHIDVNEIVVYQTISLPHKIAGTYNGILFFSPTAVHSFFTHNSVAGSTVLFAIGKTTAKAISSKTTNKVIVSDEPGKESLLAKMIAYFTP